MLPKIQLRFEMRLCHVVGLWIGEVAETYRFCQRCAAAEEETVFRELSGTFNRNCFEA